jgi:replication-associated recombination protein RarA
VSPGYRPPKTSRGYQLDEVSSSLQKCIRRGLEDQAVWWASEMDRSGHSTQLWNRLEVIASEDIGVAWPRGPAVIAALHQQWDRHRRRRHSARPERLFIVHAAALLARAKKSRRLDHALHWAYATEERRFEIPDFALDMFTAKGRRLGRGADDWEATSALLVNEADLDEDPFRQGYLAADPEAYERQQRAGGGQQGTLPDVT